MLPALIYRLNFDWRKTLGAGILTSARLSLIIAASAIGLRLGVITEPVNAAIILVAIITVMVAPTLFLRLIPEEEREEPSPIIIVDAGPLGLRIAEQLRSHNDRVVLMDAKEEHIVQARERGFETVQASVDRYHAEADSYLNEAERLVCLHSDVEKNYRVCKYVRSNYGIDHVVARVTVPRALPRFTRLGVTPMNAATDQAVLLAMLVRNPTAYELLTRVDDDREICEVVVKDSGYLNRPLQILDLPKDLAILAIRRDNELIVPRGHTRLEPGDQVTVMGSYDCVEKSRKLMG